MAASPAPGKPRAAVYSHYVVEVEADTDQRSAADDLSNGKDGIDSRAIVPVDGHSALQVRVRIGRSSDLLTGIVEALSLCLKHH
jgi:hypothetical protein